MVCGKSIGWRVALKRGDEPKIKGHEHHYMNNGGCEEHKKQEALWLKASNDFQTFWINLPKWLYRWKKSRPFSPSPTIPGCWIRLWYTGTEFACGGICK